MPDVPFDDDLAEAGLIIPDFVDTIVGWQNEDELLDAGWEPIWEMGYDVPRDWLPPWPQRETITPNPIVVTDLVWHIA